MDMAVSLIKRSGRWNTDTGNWWLRTLRFACSTKARVRAVFHKMIQKRENDSEKRNRQNDTNAWSTPERLGYVTWSGHFEKTGRSDGHSSGGCEVRSFSNKEEREYESLGSRVLDRDKKTLANLR